MILRGLSGDVQLVTLVALIALAGTYDADLRTVGTETLGFRICSGEECADEGK